MGQRGAVLAGLPALLVLAVGVGLLAAPWWSATLPPDDRPIAVVLGAIFAAGGAFALVPEDWERLRTLAFVAFIGGFGLVCAALASSPFRPGPDGTLTIGGSPGLSHPARSHGGRASWPGSSRSCSSAGHSSGGGDSFAA